MGTISRYNSVQFENLNANELVGVTLVYKSVNRDGETHYSGLNFAGDEYTPKDKTQDEIFRVWKNVVATFWTVKAVEAGLREDNGGIASKLRSGTPAEIIVRTSDCKVQTEFQSIERCFCSSMNFLLKITRCTIQVFLCRNQTNTAPYTSLNIPLL